MSKAAKITEATHSIYVKISAWLGLVVAVNCSDVVKTWETLRHGVVTISKLLLPMSKRAGITQCTCMSQLVMPA